MGGRAQQREAAAGPPSPAAAEREGRRRWGRPSAAPRHFERREVAALPAALQGSAPGRALPELCWPGPPHPAARRGPEGFALGLSLLDAKVTSEMYKGLKS